MTTYDQQPQSRRAVRQSERDDAAEQASAQQFTAPAGDMWDTVSRRAAQLPPVSLQDESPAGRRAATPPAEPLHYSTQSRTATPDGPTFRARGSAAPQPVPYDTANQPPTQAIEQQSGYRVRDFSPSSPWSAPGATAAPQPASDLDYHTEARFRAAAERAASAPVSEVPASVAPINDKVWAAPAPAPEPVLPSAAASDFPLEHTFTRRELRAMQQAEEAERLRAQGLPVPEQSTLTTQQPEAPVLSTQQPVLSTQQPVLSTQQPVASPFPLVEPGSSAPTAHTPAPAVPAAYTPAPVEPVSASPFDSLFTPPAATVPPQAPVAQVPADIAPPPAPVAEPSPWTPPTGHWSSQLEARDDDEVETTVSRRVGSGTATTSALVLPSIPMGNDIRGPLTSTGEIMLTGSIDLPLSLATTGQSDRFDKGGIDDLFDLSDHEVISTDSSPVRAIRAVSTHTSGHGVTHTQKPKGTRALTALLIAASSMAVVVAGLLVAAFAFNVF